MIYQSFNFTDIEELKKVFYSGDALLVNQKDISQKELIDIGLIGQGNFEYDGWCIGENEISLSWDIDRKVYIEAMAKLSTFFHYYEISEIVEYEIKEED